MLRAIDTRDKCYPKLIWDKSHLPHQQLEGVVL